MIVIAYYPVNGTQDMIAIDYSLREFIHQLTKVHWEWLLAALILIAYSFKSRLESRSHRPKTVDDALSAVRKVTPKT